MALSLGIGMGLSPSFTSATARGPDPGGDPAEPSSMSPRPELTPLGQARETRLCDPLQRCGRPERHAEIAPEPTPRLEETEMPKMKTKSSAKKRFKVTGTGKVMAAQAGKRHGMIKRTNKFIRNARGTTFCLSEPDQKIVKSYMPYDR
jgi:large subunit ribosomal protein L35